MRYTAKIPTKRLLPNCSATHPPADAMSCGRVIATYANAIGATNIPVLTTVLIASYAPSADTRITLFSAVPSAAARRIVFFSAAAPSARLEREAGQRRSHDEKNL